jgi:two-component sensor histidine kinase
MHDKPIAILLVEDNPGDARLLQELLTEVAFLECRIALVGRLDHALRCLEETRFDLVVLDLGLPDEQGFDTFSRVQQRAAQTPIIVLTGFEDETLGLRTVRGGAQDYLVKGQFDGSLLARAMRYAIERKRMEEQLQASLREKEALLKEIHHRVKNNLQVVSSLLALQADSVTDPQVCQMFRDSRSRIRAMGLIHERLYHAGDLTSINAAEYVRDLVAQLYSIYANPARVIGSHVRVDDIILGIDTAIPCGLLLTELVSNALKHAFPPDWAREGSVHVELCAAEAGLLTLVVSDDGVGLPPDLDLRYASSLGLQLVDLLAGQVNGIVELDRSSGTTFRVTFPRDERQPSREFKEDKLEDSDRRGQGDYGQEPGERPGEIGVHDGGHDLLGRGGYPTGERDMPRVGTYGLRVAG